jgi:hypothetical protein
VNTRYLPDLDVRGSADQQGRFDGRGGKDLQQTGGVELPTNEAESYGSEDDLAVDAVEKRAAELAVRYLNQGVAAPSMGCIGGSVQTCEDQQWVDS